VRFVAVFLGLVVVVFVGCANAKGNASLAEMFNPPKDLFVDLYNGPVVIEKDKVVSFDLNHKYPGRHQVGLYLSKMTSEHYSDGNPGKTKFRIDLRFTEDNEVILRKELGAEITPFIGKESNGVILMVYKVPEDLPLKKSLHVTAKIVEADDEFNSEFGEAKLFIKKMSDL